MDQFGLIEPVVLSLPYAALGTMRPGQIGYEMDRDSLQVDRQNHQFPCLVLIK